MLDPKTQATITAHSINPVPFIVVSDELKNAALKTDGRLSDIAPTVLDLMNLEQPQEMSGQSLIQK